MTAPLSDQISPSTPERPHQWVLTVSCGDRPGIVHAVTGAIVTVGGNITESQQYGNPVTGRFFMRVQIESGVPHEVLAEALAPVVRQFGMTWTLTAKGEKMRTLVLVSKAAHCLNHLLFQQRAGQIPIEIPAIVGNHRDLEDLAKFYDVPFHYVPVTKGTKAEAEAEIARIADAAGVELIVLARYMQILSDDFCSSRHGSIINIHHSFLPSFKGARPYNQAHDRGVKLIGATAHYVTADLDEGPIIEQDVQRVDHHHSVEQFVALGQDVESRTLTRAVKWHAEHRVLLDGHRTVVFR